MANSPPVGLLGQEWSPINPKDIFKSMQSCLAFFYVITQTDKSCKSLQDFQKNDLKPTVETSKLVNGDLLQEVLVTPLCGANSLYNLPRVRDHQWNFSLRFNKSSIKFTIYVPRRLQRADTLFMNKHFLTMLSQVLTSRKVSSGLIIVSRVIN